MSSTGASAGAEPPLRIIAGPTGAGKSALALAAAERLGAVIVSADSRQVYRGFDIGTAKPTAAERARVRHEGVDVAEPMERWSAARWAAAATAWIAAARAGDRPAVVVGGTGLWLRALVRPLADEPEMDPNARRALQQELARLETPALRERVAQLDPARAHLGRTQLLRAAEVALLTGTRISDWHAAGEAKPARRARWLVVDPGPALQARLATRVDAMLDAGWEAEVRALASRVPADAPAWNACGYNAIRDLVRGTRDRAAVRDEVFVRTRQYAKRQRTWFRNQLDDEPAVTRLDPRDPAATRRAVDWLFEGVDA
jgi:tRNA dimethylallyltransferase